MTQSRIVNAIIGALVTILLTFTAISPVLGGAFAAWLEEGDMETSIQVGALSGLFAFLPFLVVVPGIVAMGIIFRPEIFILMVFLASFAAYFILLGAIGGYVAFYLLQDPRIPGEPDL